MRTLNFTKGKGPLTWGKVTTIKGALINVRVTCENGHRAQLDHTVGVTGEVLPSIVCPEDDCDFHIKGYLTGWEHEEMLPRGGFKFT